MTTDPSKPTPPSDTHASPHEDKKVAPDSTMNPADEQTRQRLSRFLLYRIKLLSSIIAIGVIVLVLSVFQTNNANRSEKFKLSSVPISPLASDLFDTVGQNIGVFSQDASFFDEQEADLEEINTAYEDQ